mmetsp:Transcript_50397/g.114393  ORF Transcript_50397/g.114393 Transcript_50397/m.114393 type:complete len:402 (+) Transcript_50397:167-1372(+)
MVRPRWSGLSLLISPIFWWAINVVLLPTRAQEGQDQVTNEETSGLAGRREHPRNDAARLIVHVGPHKTGTTSVQHVLFRNKYLIFDKLHVRVGASQRPQEGTFVAATIENRTHPETRKDYINKYVDENRVNFVLRKIRGWLDAGETVVISSETFDQVSTETLVTVAGWCNSTTFVHAHRAIVDEMHSIWSQIGKSRSNPRSFEDFLVRETDGINFLDYMDRLEEVQQRFDPGVVEIRGTAYEGAHMIEFVLCDVALSHLESSQRAACKAFVQDFEVLHSNRSPSGAAIDVVRLSRNAALVLGCEAPTINALSPEVAEVAKKLPLVSFTGDCTSHLDYLQAAYDRAFFARTGIAPPERAPCLNHMDFVNESALTSQHWSLIQGLLVECSKDPPTKAERSKQQ